MRRRINNDSIKNTYLHLRPQVDYIHEENNLENS